MGIGVYFSISTFIIITILAIIFFSKKRVVNVETKTYGTILIVTLIGLFLEVFTCAWYVIGVSLDNIIYQFISKLTSSYYMLWSCLFVNYLINICNGNNTFKKVFNIFNLICFVLILILPISYSTEGIGVIPTGESIILTYITCIIYAFIDLIICLKYRKKITNSKFTPVYSLLVLGGIDIFLGVFSPSLFLIGYVYSLIVIIMYFTIENPDVKMIEQLRQNKKLIEQGNEDKSNFLFRMSQEVKSPIDDIIRVNNIMNNTDDLETIKKGIKYIDYNSKELKALLNDVLDVTKMDAYNIKMINSTYNVYNIFTELFTRYENIIDKEIEFRYNMSKNIPEILYGDSVKLKQVVITILENAYNHTKKGFIDINVDSIVKNNICRLIISISDSGSGMSLDKVNQLLSLSNDLTEEDLKKLDKMNLDLNIATKIIKLLGGQIIIKSEENVGSEFIIAIEQRIDKNNDINLSEELDDYSNLSSNKKRVLVVSDKKSELDNISEYLEKNNIEVVKSMYGLDCIDRIRNKQKYDLILMEDEMTPLTGINTLQKLQQIKHFKTPVVIMLEKNKEAIKHHYIEEGFSDYLLKENIEIELDRIIKNIL